jgi:hypothetical protein
MFLELEMTVHVLRDLVVSVLLPVVELLRSGAVVTSSVFLTTSVLMILRL